MNTLKTAGQELTRIAKELVSAITIVENDTQVMVKGSYNEMAPMLQRLKNMGFKWNSNDRVWYIAKDKLTAQKEKNLQELVGGKNNEQEEAREKAVARLNATGDQLKGSQWFTLIVGYQNFYLEGKTYDVKDECFLAGGKWTGKAYAFTFSTMKPDAVEKLMDKVIDIDGRYEKAFQNGTIVAKRLIDTEVAGVKFRIAGKQFQIMTPERGFNDAIKSVFERAVWANNAWEVPLYRVTDKLADALVAALTQVYDKKIEQQQKKLEQDTKERAGRFTISRGSSHRGEAYQEGQVVRNYKENITNGEPEWLFVLKVTSRYFKEDGMSFGVGDDQGYLHIAECRAATPEEIAPVAQERDRRLKEKDQKAQAEKDLRQIVEDIRSKGELPPRNPDGTGHRPKGEIIDIGGKNLQMYGGGDWFVMGSDYIWYVKNNGADGDSWDFNNVSTGGAGAIGWRVPYNKELEEKIRSTLALK